MPTPEFTYQLDSDSNCLMIYLDGEEFVEYWCEHDPEDMTKEVRRVFEAGMSYRNPQSDALAEALRLAEEMFIANDLDLPKTFEVMDEALAAHEEGKK